MECDVRCTRFHKFINAIGGVAHHQMHIERKSGFDCLHHRRPKAQIRHKMAIHHIHLQPIRIGSYGIYFLLQAGKICRENGGSNDEFKHCNYGYGYPSISWSSFILRTWRSPSSLEEGSPSNGVTRNASRIFFASVPLIIRPPRFSILASLCLLPMMASSALVQRTALTPEILLPAIHSPRPEPPRNTPGIFSPSITSAIFFAMIG